MHKPVAGGGGGGLGEAELGPPRLAGAEHVLSQEDAAAHQGAGAVVEVELTSGVHGKGGVGEHPQGYVGPVGEGEGAGRSQGVPPAHVPQAHPRQVHRRPHPGGQRLRRDAVALEATHPGGLLSRIELHPVPPAEGAAG